MHYKVKLGFGWSTVHASDKIFGIPKVDVAFFLASKRPQILQNEMNKIIPKVDVAIFLESTKWPQILQNERKIIIPKIAVAFFLAANSLKFFEMKGRL